MKTYPTSKIKKVFKALYPRLKDRNLLWIRAKRYKMYDSLDHVKSVVRESIKEYRYVSGAYECEFKATQLMAAVWEYHYRKDVESPGVEGRILPEKIDPYFFGLCLGFKFKSHDGNHNVCIALFGDCEIVFIDASGGMVWAAEKTDDPYMILR